MRNKYLKKIINKITFSALIVLVYNTSYADYICTGPFIPRTFSGPNGPYGSLGEGCFDISPDLGIWTNPDSFGGGGFCADENGDRTRFACGFLTLPFTPDKERNLGSSNECPIGNPINPHTGNKYQTETDYVRAGTFRLAFSRFYNSDSAVTSTRIGQNWRGSYDKTIDDNSGLIIVTRSDGKVIKFYSNNSGDWFTDPNIVERLEELLDAQNQRTGWQLTTSDDKVESYAADGKLLTITNRNGLTQSLTYDRSLLNGGDDDPETLDTVTDPFGRSLSFAYNENGQVSSITDPASNTYNYSYDANNNLSLVISPDDTPDNSGDNPRRIYHYEDTNFIHALTGITNENGNRFASWGYDTQGRAIFSEHAGGAERIDFVYNDDSTTLVIDSSGDSQTYHTKIVFGLARTEQIDGGSCSLCGGQNQNTTYDPRGFIASHTDFNGNVTTYINNSRGLETSRTEAVGTPEERTIATEWHSTFRLPIKITEPGRITEFT